jgi:Flp pilus assembly protein TadB
MSARSTLRSMEKTEKTGSSLGRKAVAVLVLALAAWLLLKVVIGLIAGIAWIVVAVVVVAGVIWAVNTLS